MFIISGKRLIIFENSATEKNNKNVNEDVYPINVGFNEYFNQFVVLTKLDIRLFDAMTGKLKKVLNELHDPKLHADLSNSCFGAKQRKCFISDSAGLIR